MLHDDQPEAEETERTGEAERPTFTLNDVRDSVVSPNTLSVYIGAIMQFLKWCNMEHPDWLTGRTCTSGTEC